MSNQEQIVDGIVIEQLITEHPELEKVIKSTSKFQIRKAVLSILDKDRKLYEDYKKLDELNSVDNYLTYTDEIVNKVREYIQVKDTEVKTHGEVTTPIWLVEDMLNTLPSDVWTNPNLKWLDPCNGVGTYPSIIVQRLMKGLEDVIKNPKKRYRHIVEEMLYVCELQATNMFVFQCVFDKEDIYELNTYCGSFLDEKFDEHMTNVWGVEKFDIVVGNPPYQDNTGNKGVGHTLWNKFVIKSLNILIEGGYLNMVHPSGWRNVDGGFKDVKILMKKKEILSLCMNSFDKGKETFGVQTDYDYYCIKNIENTNIITKIINVSGEYEEFDVKLIDFIPNKNIKCVYDLVAKEGEEKVNILHSESTYAHRKDYMSAEKNDLFKYPCIWSIKKGGIPTFKYSSINKGHFGVSKVILSNGSAVIPIVDKVGEYGLTQFGYSIVDDINNLDDIAKALNNKKFIEDIIGFVGLGDKYNRKVIGTFRKDFYKQFIND